MGVKGNGKKWRGLSQSSTWLWLPHRNKPAPLRPITNVSTKPAWDTWTFNTRGLNIQPVAQTSIITLFPDLWSLKTCLEQTQMEKIYLTYKTLLETKYLLADTACCNFKTLYALALRAGILHSMQITEGSDGHIFNQCVCNTQENRNHVSADKRLI